MFQNSPVQVFVRRVAMAVVFSFLGINLAGAQAPGGFVESASGNGLRSRLSSGQIQSFVPQRGAFTFPAPYGTQGFRLTNSGDCAGQDCVNPVGYSYWRNINNSAGSATMLVFLGLERRKGGAGPTLFSVNKNTGETRNLGALFSSDSAYSWASGEGWYFSATRPTTLYVPMGGSSTLQRYDVNTHSLSTVFNVASRTDVFGSNRVIWQVHSSNDDRVHSATLKDGSSYAELGCFAYREDTNQFFYYPQKGLNYDECQIDKSGRYLIIKEKTGLDSSSEVDDRIIDLQTGVEQTLLDRNGAGGHSDNGFGYMLASDNFNPQSGAVRLWNLGMDMRGGEPVANVRGQGTLVYQTSSWAYDVGHVSFSNARNGAIEQQYACSSNVSRQDLPRANEVVCFKLDGSMTTVVAAPVMTDLNASGGGSDDYWKYPKGNLDPTGEYFIWTANSGTGRMDAYIVRIPYQLLGGAAPSPSPSPAPAPTPAPTPAPAPSPSPSPNPTGPTSFEAARWMSLINVTASGNNLRKSGGCDGCPDGTAVSEQQATAVDFTPSETGSLRFIGLGSGSVGATASDLSYALRLQGGTVEVRELGAYKTETSFGAGDRLRISVEGGSVKYSKNGAVFFTSGAGGSSWHAHAVLFNAGAAVGDVKVGIGSPTASAAPSPNAPTASDTISEGEAEAITQAFAVRTIGRTLTGAELRALATEFGYGGGTISRSALNAFLSRKAAGGLVARD